MPGTNSKLKRGAPCRKRDTPVSDLLSFRFAHEFVQEQVKRQHNEEAAATTAKPGTAHSEVPPTADAQSWVRPDSRH